MDVGEHSFGTGTRRAPERSAQNTRSSNDDDLSNSKANVDTNSPQPVSELVKQVQLLTRSVAEIQGQLEQGRNERKALVRFAVKVSRSTSDLNAAHAKAASSRGDSRLRSRALQASDDIQNALVDLVYDITGVSCFVVVDE